MLDCLKKLRVSVWLDKGASAPANQCDGEGWEFGGTKMLLVNPKSPCCFARGREMTQVWWNGEWQMLHEFKWEDGTDALYVTEKELAKHLSNLKQPIMEE